GWPRPGTHALRSCSTLRPDARSCAFTGQSDLFANQNTPESIADNAGVFNATGSNFARSRLLICLLIAAIAAAIAISTNACNQSLSLAERQRQERVTPFALALD